MSGTTKIIIYHTGYGCDTGRCGHVVEAGGDEHFFFDHPWNEDFREWAEGLIREQFGEEHVADLDWDECVIVDD